MQVLLQKEWLNMEQLKSMKQCLMAQVQGQMGNLQNVDYEELGAAIDMIKDLEEAIYYCTIVEAMGEKDKQQPQINYYSEPSRTEREGRENNTSSGSRYYTERPIEWQPRDMREGRSPMQRRTYMESKEMHQGKEKEMQELEKYMQELSTDITEMIKDASPEEKQILKTKITNLASKIM